MHRAALAGLIVLLCALNGCAGDGPAGPVPVNGGMIAVGVFRDRAGIEGASTEIHITYGSIDSLAEDAAGGSAIRDLWTAPVSISVPRGDDRVRAILARLDSNPLRLRYLARADGGCALLGRMELRDGDVYADMQVTGILQDCAGPDGFPTMDNVWSVEGHVYLRLADGDAAEQLQSAELVLSVYGNRLLCREL